MVRIKKKHSISIACISIWLFTLACGLYSFKGSLPPHLKTVAIPLFENRTAEFGIAEQLTDDIIDEFTRDNSLKITDPSSADVLIEGSIMRVNDRAGAFTQRELVQELKVYITVNIKCTDQVKHQTMWEERITQWGSYDPSGGPDARLDGIAEAIDKISEQVLTKTVSAW